MNLYSNLTIRSNEKPLTLRSLVTKSSEDEAPLPVPSSEQNENEAEKVSAEK